MLRRDTALLIIDMQVGLLAPAYHNKEVVENINLLRRKAHAAAAPVVYVQHDGPRGHGLEVGSPAWQIHPALTPAEDEVIIHKRSSDAFHATDLQRELDRRGIKHLVTVGGQTQYCVDTTVRRATTCGYDVTLVSDAHTTLDSPPWTAAMMIDYHNEVLDDFRTDQYTILVKETSKITF